jgi:hypothetical protein
MHIYIYSYTDSFVLVFCVTSGPLLSTAFLSYSILVWGLGGVGGNPPHELVPGSPRTEYGGGSWFWFVFSVENILSSALFLSYSINVDERPRPSIPSD